MAVYFIRDAERLEVKIGYSYSPERRMKALQSGHRRPLQLLKTLPGARAEEAALHRRFKEYKIWGEWFHLTGKLARFIGRKRPPVKPKPSPIDELVREAVTAMVAAKYTDEQMAAAFRVSTETIYNLLNET